MSPAFADEHNFAFFVCGNDLILIDCPVMSFQKIKKMKELSEFDNIFIRVTHTHSDHSGGVDDVSVCEVCFEEKSYCSCTVGKGRK